MKLPFRAHCKQIIDFIYFFVCWEYGKSITCCDVKENTELGYYQTDDLLSSETQPPHPPPRDSSNKYGNFPENLQS